MMEHDSSVLVCPVDSRAGRRMAEEGLMRRRQIHRLERILRHLSWTERRGEAEGGVAREAGTHRRCCGGQDCALRV